MKNLGIHLRLLLAGLALISATTFALGYVGINISRQFIQSRFEKRISFLAKYLALNAELGVLIDNRGMLNKLAANLMTEDDVAGVVILDKDNRQITAVSRDVPGPFSKVETPILLSESGEYGEAFEWYSVPDQGEKIIGRIRITFSTGEIGQVLATMANRFIWLSAGLTCLAALIFYFLSRSLVAPVTQLAKAARQVAQGDFGLRVQPRGSPETRRLARAFNSMLDSLEKNREALEGAYKEIMKQDTLAELGKFSLMIAHEVKNPLSIIKSSLDVLKKDPVGSSNSPMVVYMEDEIRRLNRMIEDFLAFARPAQPCFCTIDVNALLHEIVTRFELQEAGSAIEIESRIPTEPCEAYADPDLLTRAISNILKNAFDANRGRGTVRVTASCQNSTWTVDIEDQGEGIALEHINKIFEPFFTTRSKGTGLGLAYVSQVIRAHNGSVGARNRDRGGAVFSVALPVRQGKEKV